ncbi:hypothetical protein Ahy_B05g078371 [Arachis hypogaea]|uniref:Protein FAR1-RELATED SEQUENCE n=1 Tax=Arachis hypogaea TaxID=3818 RepID=A0A444Z6Z0_ARAHY|nr:hypothetical protein Ahy_B05g078371 [Arachis hypogaea]
MLQKWVSIGGPCLHRVSNSYKFFMFRGCRLERHTDEFELLLIKMFVEIGDAGDGMIGETVLVKEAEAMNLSAADTDIDVKASVRIVDGIAAYDCYNEYGRIKGFSVRWSKVHVDDTSGRWFVEQFCDNHNHPMLDAKFRGLMQSYRTVKEEVDKFERIWMDSVAKFGLENHPWIADMYARKHSWSNAHIRGKFFVGLKTTSRCKALNMQIGKFIHNGYNLREFVEYFQHYLEFM